MMEWYGKLALVFTLAVFAAVWMSIAGEREEGSGRASSESSVRVRADSTPSTVSMRSASRARFEGTR